MFPIDLQTIGLLLNFLGSLFIAFSVKKNPGGAHQQPKHGSKIYLAVIDHKKFIFGIYTLIIGFILQLLDRSFSF